MGNKIKSIIIGGIALVLLLITMLILVLTDKPKEQNEQGLQNSSVVVLWKHDVDSIKKVEVNNDKGNYIVSKNDKGDLVIDELSDYPLIANEFISLKNVLSTFTATRVVEKNPEDIEKYGFNNPVATASVTFEDGTVNTIKLGKMLPTDGGYYTMINDDTTVYAVAKMDVANLLYKAVDYIDHFIIRETEDNFVEKLRVDGANFKEKPLIIELDENQKYFIKSPIEAEINSFEGKEVVEGLYTLYAEEIAAVGNGAEYGFSSPYAVIDYTKDGIDGKLYIGDSTDIDSVPARYVMTDKSDIIYKVDASLLPWTDTVIDELYNDLVLIPNINTVDTITLSFKGESHVFKSKGEKDSLTATLDGNEIDTVNYRTMYEFLISAIAKEINYGEVKGESIVKVVYKYRDSKIKDDVIEFFACDERRCIISLNGAESFLTERRYVDKIISNLEKVRNGEKPLLDY